MISPIEWLRWPRNARASTLGRYLSCSIAVWTRCVVSAETRTVPLNTRETVIVPTPASLATSLMVALRWATGATARCRALLTGWPEGGFANSITPGTACLLRPGRAHEDKDRWALQLSGRAAIFVEWAEQPQEQRRLARGERPKKDYSSLNTQIGRAHV